MFRHEKYIHTKYIIDFQKIRTEEKNQALDFTWYNLSLMIQKAFKD